MNIRRFALIYGIVFLIVGAAGFLPHAKAVAIVYALPTVVGLIPAADLHTPSA